MNDTDTDGPQEDLLVTGISNTVNGTANSVITDNQVIFTPTADYFGLASFDYGLSDGKGGTDTGTVNVQVLGVTQQGTAANDTLTGTLTGNTVADVDVLVGGLGNDTLVGGLGNNLLYGDAGDDIFIYNPLSMDKIFGGTGTDTIKMNDAGNSLDITANNTTVFYNNYKDIEQIDLRGSGDNSLTLDKFDVFTMTDADNELYIFGNTGDTLTLAGVWTQSDIGVMEYGSCVDYTQVVNGQTVTLCVDDDITGDFSIT
jgi:hypothetical protein